MLRTLVLVVAILSLPLYVQAATLVSGERLVTSKSFTGNLYEAGGDIRLSVEAPEDVLFAGGTLTLAAPVLGDAFLLGGTIDVQQQVHGDARLLGGRIIVSKDVAGDLILVGGSVTTIGSIPETYGVAGTIDIQGGAHAPITLYGSTVLLSGTFTGDVDVTASDKIVIAPGTIIEGALKYNAPQEIVVPATAQILGAVEYTGSSSFLPSAEEAQNFARAGVGIFLVIKILAAMLAVGLIAGLFPEFASSVANETLGKGMRRFALLFLLGFAVAFATPVLILLLLLSFVGIGVALFVGTGYILLLLLSGIYAGVLAGSALARTLWKRTNVTWQDALLGTLLLGVISIIPYIGGFVSFALAITALGAVVRAAYLFAFIRKQEPFV